jgi:hypothetical protein
MNQTLPPIFAGLFAVAPAAFAQPAGQNTGQPAGEAERSPWSFNVRGEGEIAFKTDLDNSPGSVAIYRAQSGFGAALGVSKSLRLSADFETEQSWYNFSAATGVVPGSTNPLNHTSSYTVNPGVGIVIDDQWSVRLGGRFEWSQEGGGPRGNAFTAGGLVGVRYAFSKDFALTGGLAATSRLEESTLFIPVLGVEWQINETLRFETRGLGAALTAKLNDQWSVFIDGGYASREFRLDDTNAQPEGILRDRRGQVGAGVSFAPAPFIEFTLRGGAVVWSEFRVDDRNGNELRTIDAKPTPYIALSGTIRF